MITKPDRMVSRAGRVWLATTALAWPPLASGARSCCCCLHCQAVLPAAPRRCRTTDPPRVATPPLPMSSHHRCVHACPLHLYPTAGLVICHLWHYGRLAIYGTAVAWAMPSHGRACLSTAPARGPPRSRRPHPTKVRSSQAHLPRLVSLFLSFSLCCRRRAAPSNYLVSDHLHSIQCIHGFNIMFSRCLTPPSLESCKAKLQFGVFPAAVPLWPHLAMVEGSPPTVPPEQFTYTTSISLTPSSPCMP